jgi:hypothetical protein
MILRHAPLDPHPDAVARPQRDERPRFDGRAGCEAQTIALRQRRQHEMRFDHRELVADALARPGAERQVGELRPGGRALRREAIGIEPLRIIPVSRQPMDDERHDEHDPSTRDVIAADLVRSDRLARNAPCRRVEAHRLFDHHARVVTGRIAYRAAACRAPHRSPLRGGLARQDTDNGHHASASDVVVTRE